MNGNIGLVLRRPDGRLFAVLAFTIAATSSLRSTSSPIQSFSADSICLIVHAAGDART